MKNKNRCLACGRTWDMHDGIQVTCQKSQLLREALKLIALATNENTIRDIAIGAVNRSKLKGGAK